jgi:hypothetical protein
MSMSSRIVKNCALKYYSHFHILYFDTDGIHVLDNLCE